MHPNLSKLSFATKTSGQRPNSFNNILISLIILLIMMSSGCTWKWWNPGDNPSPTNPPTTSPPTTSPPTTDPPTTTPPTTPSENHRVVGSHMAPDSGLLGLLLLYSLAIFSFYLKKYSSRTIYWKRFVLRLAAFSSLGYAISLLLPTRYLQYSFSLISSSALSFLGITTLSINEFLLVAIREGGYYMIIISPFCVGWGPISNYIALILSVPDIKRDSRLKAVIFGFPVIFLINFLKIPVEAYASHLYGSQSWISQLDHYLATAIMVLVYITWVIWIKGTFKTSTRKIILSNRSPKSCEA